jgi:hypothetical protein
MLWLWVDGEHRLKFIPFFTNFTVNPPCIYCPLLCAFLILWLCGCFGPYESQNEVMKNCDVWRSPSFRRGRRFAVYLDRPTLFFPRAKNTFLSDFSACDFAKKYTRHLHVCEIRFSVLVPRATWNRMSRGQMRVRCQHNSHRAICLSLSLCYSAVSVHANCHRFVRGAT